MASTAPPSGGFGRALSIQADVIGALIMRELHTRYGRDNIGYLWLIGEPLMLATVIGAFHTGSSDHFSSDLRPVPFAVLGYVVYIIFRGMFNRADGTLEANRPLLYHRMVSLLDVMIAKGVIEAAGCVVTLILLLAGCVALGFGEAPERPLWLMAGVALMCWLSFAASLIVVAYTYESPLLERLVHPFSYFMMPICGAFYTLSWLPNPFRGWMEWNPMVIIFEISRYGLFKAGDPRYVQPIYVVACCTALTYWGLIGIRRTRRRIHLS